MSMTSESFSSGAGPIPLDVYSPGSGGKHSVVLILHGTLGLEAPFGADIVSFAEALNTSGIAAAIPHYFESTKTKAGDEALSSIPVHLAAWKLTCAGALSFLAADARFDAARMGIIGFSLGGHIALSLALKPAASAKIRGVVDFFGPTNQLGLEGDWSALPPALIHHGTADKLVDIENSQYVVAQLEKVHRVVTSWTFGTPAPSSETEDKFITYPGQGHGFTGAALAASRDVTIQFLNTHLK